MNKRMYNTAVITLLIFFVCCAKSYNVRVRNAEKKFYEKNEPYTGAKALLPDVNKENRDQLLFMIEAGMMLHASEKFKDSNRVLLQAARLADRVATSISKQTASLLLNDTFTNYKGHDFEKVLIHMYLGINYLLLKEYEEAYNDFKKVIYLLKEIEGTTEQDFKKNLYKQNLMARYLFAIAFEQNAILLQDFQDLQDAYIEYKQVHKRYQEFPLVKQDLMRVAKMLDDDEDFVQWKNKFKREKEVPKDAGQLIMIFEAGRGPQKKSRGKLLSDHTMKRLLEIEIEAAKRIKAPQLALTAAGITYSLNKVENPIPKYEKRSNKIQYLKVKATQQGIMKGIFRTYMLENIENTSIRNMEDNYPYLKKRVAVGIATKVVGSLATAYGAQKLAYHGGRALKEAGGCSGFFIWEIPGLDQLKVFGQMGDFFLNIFSTKEGSKIVGAAAGLGTAVALFSQVKPDLRCWHSLPANLQIGRIYLKPGEYDIEVNFYDSSNSRIRTETEKVKIEKDEITFLNYRTLY